MKFLYTIIAFLVFTINVHSQPVLEWQRTFGGSETERARCIFKSYGVGYIIAGESGSDNGDLTSNAGLNDCWLIKINQQGIIQWQKSYGGSLSESFYSAGRTTDGGYIAGGTSKSNDGNISDPLGSNDCWIVKTDAAGNLIWERSFGGSQDDHLSSIMQTADGGYIFAGSVYSDDGYVTNNNGETDIWLVKLNSAGIIDWQKNFGGSLDDHAHAVIPTKDHGYLLAGQTLSNDADVSNNYGNVDAWVIKTDSTGNLLWEKNFGGTGNEIFTRCIEDSTGNFLFAGTTDSDDFDVSFNHGQSDFWLVKTDSTGTILWEKTAGGSAGEELNDLCYADGGFIAAGVSGSSDGDRSDYFGYLDGWIIKFDMNGNILWDKSTGGPDVDILNAVFAEGNDVLVAGSTLSSGGDISGLDGINDLYSVKFTSEFNTISGTLYHDENLNNQHDPSERLMDRHFTHDVTSGGSAISKADGKYELNLFKPDNYFLYPSPLKYFTTSPAMHYVPITAADQKDSLNDFPFSASGTNHDLQIFLNPVTKIVPGNNAIMEIHYKNRGTIGETPVIVFYPDTGMTFISSNPSPSFVYTDSVIWNSSNLNPMDEGTILLNMELSSTLAMNENLVPVAGIFPVITDAFTPDNFSASYLLTENVQSPLSISVNRTELLNTEMISPPYLDYIIHFQNTGQDTINYVKVLTNLDANLDISTFEFISASHPFHINYYNHSRLLDFRYSSMQLIDSLTNEPLSHGYIHYRIKPVQNLVTGDSIVSMANIYFQNQHPVSTNIAITQIIINTSVKENEEKSISIYPNPASTGCHVELFLDNPSDVNMILTDLLGKTIYTNSLFGQAGVFKHYINISHLAKGIYTLKIKVDKQEYLRKLVVN